MRSGDHSWVIFRRRHAIAPVVVVASIAVGHFAPGAPAAPRKPPPTAQPLWQLYPLQPAGGRKQPQPPTSTAPAPAPRPPLTTSIAIVPRPEHVPVQSTAADSGAGGTGRVWLIAGLVVLGVGALVGLVLLVRRSTRDRRRLTELDAARTGLLRSGGHRLAAVGAARHRLFRKPRGYDELDHAAIGLAALIPPLPEPHVEAVEAIRGDRPAPAPVADEPPVSGAADPLLALRAELARASLEHLAASLLLFDGIDAIDVERAIAELAGTHATGDLARWLLLPGVLPKRASELAETALATLRSEGIALEGVVIGIAGYPRHAQSATALFRLARRALEHAASSRDVSVVVARDEWTEQGPGDSAKPTEGVSSGSSSRSYGSASPVVGRRTEA